MLQIHESTIHIIFGTCVVLMEAMHTGEALVGIYLIRMRLMFHKTHPGSIYNFNITEKNSM